MATHSTIRFLAATLFWATSSQAAGPNEDLREKTGYNLFHPTPDSLLRELTTDRPDKTESPYTVDAGHYQIELDLLNYTQDCTDQTVQTLAIAPINLKVGLFNNVDLQFIAETYTIQRTSGHDPQAHETISGFGDVLIRCKTNFWGNDGGTTAGGMMPFLKLPTGATELGNGAVEGGIIFPLAITLPQEWSMGLMTEADHLRNSDSSNYHQEFINSITFWPRDYRSVGWLPRVFQLHQQRARCRMDRHGRFRTDLQAQVERPIGRWRKHRSDAGSGRSKLVCWPFGEVLKSFLRIRDWFFAEAKGACERDVMNLRAIPFVRA